MQVTQFPQRRTKNILINADFRVNQRLYVSGTATAAADEYTLDRWRVLLAGESVAFPALGADNTVTVPAGGFGQKIESLNIKGGVYTVHWQGSANCKVNGVSRKTGESFVIAADMETDVVFYGGTVNKPQLEEGSIQTGFEYRSITEEVMLCERYYEKSYSEDKKGGDVVNGASAFIMLPRDVSLGHTFSTENYKVKKRAIPTVTLYSPYTGAAGKIYNQSQGVDKSGGVTNISESMFGVVHNDAVSSLDQEYLRYSWVSDAEL